jgi:hypothetical protein
MNDGGYYSPSGYILRRRMRSEGTGHRAVDRAPQAAQPMTQPMADTMPMQEATSQPPQRPSVPYIPNRNTGITGGATMPFNSNPIMDYLQRMLLNMRPR